MRVCLCKRTCMHVQCISGCVNGLKPMNIAFYLIFLCCLVKREVQAVLIFK